MKNGGSFHSYVSLPEGNGDRISRIFFSPKSNAVNQAAMGMGSASAEGLAVDAGIRVFSSRKEGW